MMYSVFRKQWGEHMNSTQFATDFFQTMIDRDTDKMNSFWCDDNQIYINGDRQTIKFITSLPPFINLQLNTTEVIEEKDKMSILRLGWTMVLPGSIGSHNTYLTIIQSEEEFKVLSMVDFGTEEQKMHPDGCIFIIRHRQSE